MRVPTQQNPSTVSRKLEYDPLHDPIFYATRTLIGFTQGLFRSMPDGRFKWTASPETTEITITGAYPLKAETVNTRPAIVVVHGQTAYMNTTMNSFETLNVNTGNSVHRDVLSSTAVFNCVSRVGVEASNLAWFLASNIKALRGFLQRKGPFTRIGHDITIGGESTPGSLLQDTIDGGAVVVQVYVPFFIPHRWEVRGPAAVHDHVEIDINGQSSRMDTE